MTPYEVVAAPYQIYLAATGTAFPLADTAPAVAWVLLGTSGYLNYDEDGVTVEHNQTVTDWRAAGSTGPRKAFRTSEELKITVKLADLSPTQYAKVLNSATITTTGASTTVPATSAFPLLRGTTVATYALLCRGLSPMGDSYNAQYEVPLVYQAGSPKATFKKGEPAILECEFMALVDDTYGFGQLTIQSGAHS